MDDLVGEGALGLLDALRKFDTRKHTRLETYARYRIRGAILDGLRSSDPVSRDLRKKSRQVEIAREGLESALGRHAEDEEMAEALGISLKEWQATVNEISTAGFDWARLAPYGHGTGLARAPGTLEFDEQNLPSPDQDTSFDLCYRREQKDILKALLASLPERERIILRLYYTREMTMKGIAAILGIDESRVSQIHSAVIAKLRVRADAWVSNPRPKPPLVLPA
jgi:RNA polymerase sigma factor for flagellar operon FliA